MEQIVRLINALGTPAKPLDDSDDLQQTMSQSAIGSCIDERTAVFAATKWVVMQHEAKFRLESG
ncbi:MAG: hypothetical protein AAFU85_28785 [Planctomycetota bacterium]